MKTSIKTAMFALLVAVAGATTVWAGNDKPVTVSQLPAKAQQVISREFKNKTIALAKQETELLGRSYDVVFTDGTKIEFDRKGEWTEIDCGTAAVPSSLVPAAITAYVKKNFAGASVVQIERERGRYQVDLSTGMEITFGKNFSVTDIDR